MDLFPIYLSLKIATISTIISTIIGIPLAWLLTKGKFRGKSLLGAVVTLPMVLPPTVLGYYMLFVLGRKGTIGIMLNEFFGINILFTWYAAVLASTIVSIPLLVKSLQGGIEGVDKDLEDVARTLGKSELRTFLSVTIPLARRGLISGIVLSFARAMGEFGATLMIAGNIPGKTQTLAITIYDAVQAGDMQRANTLVVFISIITIICLIIMNKSTVINRW